VTQEQWVQLVGSNPSKFKGRKNPLEYVSWSECQSFLQELNNRLKGHGTFELPTEAEWEYACRAGTTMPFYTGKTISTDEANCNDRNRPRGKTTPVGSFAPNRFGLRDMHGNVWEWCQDWYGKGYYQSSPKNDPKGPAMGERRVLRGGSWATALESCRSAYRSTCPPANRSYSMGLRVVLRIPIKAKSAEAVDPQPSPPGKRGPKSRPVQIAGGGADLKNHQVRLLVKRDSDMRHDYADLRFTDEAGNQLSYWIEVKSATGAAVWVKVPAIPRAGTTITMRYGNPNAKSQSNGDATFIFFDDFSSGFNPEKWVRNRRATTRHGGAVVRNGIMYVRGGAGTEDDKRRVAWLLTKKSFPKRIVIESRFKLERSGNSVSGHWGIVDSSSRITTTGWLNTDTLGNLQYLYKVEGRTVLSNEFSIGMPRDRKRFRPYWERVWFRQSFYYDGTYSRNNLRYSRSRKGKIQTVTYDGSRTRGNVKVYFHPTGYATSATQSFLFDWIAIRSNARPDITATIGKEVEDKK